MQELAKGVRETLGQFRASFFLGDGLKRGVRHILRPLTPWFTSHRNYLCASTPWPPPLKDNVTICLFNCLSVTLLQAFSVGVYGFFFHLYLFIYLAKSGGGLSGPRNRESLFGLVSHGYTPPTSSSSAHPAFYLGPHTQTPWICLGAAGWLISGSLYIAFPYPLTNQWDSCPSCGSLRCFLTAPYQLHTATVRAMLSFLSTATCTQTAGSWLNPQTCHLIWLLCNDIYKITNVCKVLALQKPQTTERIMLGSWTQCGVGLGLSEFWLWSSGETLCQCVWLKHKTPFQVHLLSIL